MTAGTSCSCIAPEVIAAYRAARYRVETAFDLAIDVPSSALAGWQADRGVACSALITACNPASHAQSERRNQAANRQLQSELSRRKLVFSQTLALDPEDRWPDEPGFLIAGLAREAAAALGRRFGQNAIVWVGADAIPRLILLR
ncbi:MAG: DUF3293 domain-containing protein [Wenzhouxiangella sp.]|jgi:hypothetical protein|nr:DUF3293 domain-containing protein [Wenzhouxiangella sp.]